MLYYDFLIYFLWFFRLVKFLFWGYKYCFFLKIVFVVYYLLILMDGYVCIVFVLFVFYMDNVNFRLFKLGGGR